MSRSIKIFKITGLLDKLKYFALFFFLRMYELDLDIHLKSLHLIRLLVKDSSRFRCTIPTSS